MLDNIFGYWTAGGIVYPLGILCYISFDMIVMYFLVEWHSANTVMLVLVNLWNIFNSTFLKQIAKKYCCLGAYLGKISATAQSND